MRNKLFFLCLMSISVASAFAQTPPNDSTYVKKMEQELDKANNNARAQFSKNYPKPVPPAIQSQDKASINSEPTKFASPSEANNTNDLRREAEASPPKSQGPYTTPARPTEPASSNSTTPGTHQPGSYNIFVPPGNNMPSSSANSQHNASPNIYR